MDYSKLSNDEMIHRLFDVYCTDIFKGPSEKKHGSIFIFEFMDVEYIDELLRRIK